MLVRSSVELARAALGPEVDPLVRRLSHDLAIDWPRAPAAVNIVFDGPEAGREAPVRMLLAAHGSCFAGSGHERPNVRNARILDCVLAYAAFRLDRASPLATALGKELEARGHAGELARAWTALVVHAVATAVTALEPGHTSPLRRSASASMPEAMEWLAHEWPSRTRGEPVADFAKRYAEGFLLR